MSSSKADRVPCGKCGAMILPITARLHAGQCAKCRREEKQLLESKAKWKRPARPTLEELRVAAAMPERKSAERRRVFEHYCYHRPTLDELPFLREMLRDQDCVLVRAAAQSIAKLGPAAKEAVDDLLDAAGRPDPVFTLPQAYSQGLDALIRVGADPEAVIDLVHSHFGHTNWYFVRDSLHALQRLGTPKALHLLSRIVSFWWPDLDRKERRYVHKHFPEPVRMLGVSM